MPVRLGQDAFTTGKISNKNIERLIDAMVSFKLLMKVHKVKKYLAYGTAKVTASNDLLNSAGFYQTVEIIDGEKNSKKVVIIQFLKIKQIKRRIVSLM